MTRSSARPTRRTLVEHGMELEVASHGCEVVASVRGEVDMSSAARMQTEVCQEIVSTTTDVLIDLTGVHFIDSSGLGALVGARNYARQSGAGFEVRLPTGKAAKVFELTGLDQALSVKGEDDRQASAS